MNVLFIILVNVIIEILLFILIKCVFNIIHYVKYKKGKEDIYTE